MKSSDGFVLKLGIFSILIGAAMHFVEPALPQKMQFANMQQATSTKLTVKVS